MAHFTTTASATGEALWQFNQSQVAVKLGYCLVMGYTGATQVDFLAVTATASRLRIDGNTIYQVSDQAGSGGEFNIIDATDPTNLVLLGRLGPYDGDFKHLRCPSEKVGNHVWLLAHHDGVGKLGCVDVSNPAAITKLGFVTGNPAFFGAQDCTRIANTIFTIGNQLTAVNVADPAAPSIYSSLDQSGRSVVFIGGGHLAVSYGDPAKVATINANNPSAMAVAGEVAVPAGFQRTNGLAKHPTQALVYCAVTAIGGTGGGLLVIDVATVTAPTVVYSEALTTMADCVVTADGKGLIVGGQNTLRFYDLAPNPASPVLTGTWTRDQDPPGVNKDLLDPGAGRMLALKASNERHLFAKGDNATVLAYDLVPLMRIVGWRVGVA